MLNGPISSLILLLLHVCVCRRSSKNRRKAERKKLSLKEGSPMEDRALMYALGEIITTVDKMRGTYRHSQVKGYHNSVNSSKKTGSSLG